MSLYTELRRRNVFGMGVLYVVGAWAALQVADLAFPAWNIPDSSILYVWIAAVLGLPIALVFSWRFDVTVKGVKRTPSVHEGTAGLALKTTDHVLLIGLSAVAIAMLTVTAQEIVKTRGAIGLTGAQAETIFTPPAKSIGVLAFKNMSGDPEQGYFSDGVAEQVMTRLAQIKVLKVIARETMWRYKNESVDIGEVAREVNVKYVLEGSVQRSGDRLRISVHLIDGEDNSQVWSENYDREWTVDSLFEIQTDIANAIASEMRITIEQVGPGGLAPTANVNAYDVYLQALDAIRLREIGRSIRHLEHALRLDDNFAPARAQLAIAVLLRGVSGQYTAEDATRMAAAYLDQADALEPDLALVQSGRALLALRSRDPESTVAYARAALAGNPNDVDAMNWMQLALFRLGRYDEGEKILQGMLDIDPKNVAVRINYIDYLVNISRCEEADALASELVDLKYLDGYRWRSSIALLCAGEIAEALVWGLKLPNAFELAGWSFAFVGEFDEARRLATNREYWFDILDGKYEKAIEATQRNLEQNPEGTWYMGEAADVLYLDGKFEESLPIFERMLEFAPENRPVSGWSPLMQTMRFAFARRITGDEAGAQAVAQIARKDYEAQRAAGRLNQEFFMVEAMIAAFDQDHEVAIAALRTAIHEYGWRLSALVGEPIFHDLVDDPQFIKLRQELDAILAVEHEKILQLICFNNPMPNEWRPLPETCEGVVEKPVT